MRKIRPLLNSLLIALPLAVSATAAAIAPAHPAFDVQIYDRTEGRLLPTYQFEGRTYVVGRPGNEYSISLRNRSGERLMAVTSVDGVNIVTGQTASPAQSGYVLSPWQTADISGWRKNLNNVAAFYFTDHGDSYASRTGRPNDVGVIGVAVYRERRVQPPIPYEPYRESRPYGPSHEYGYRSGPAESAASGAAQGRDAAAAPPPPAPASPAARPDSYSNAPSAQSSADAGHARADPGSSLRREKSLGTGHGRIEDSRTRYTDFQRASSSPDHVITIYYDTYNNLLAMGVPVWRDDHRYGYRKPAPRPFPRDPTLGFVPDPR